LETIMGGTCGWTFTPTALADGAEADKALEPAIGAAATNAGASLPTGDAVQFDLRMLYAARET
jgi:hypothetical protein